MLMLPQADRALLRKDELTKYLEWKLCGSAVSNLSNTSGIHIKSFNDIYTIPIYKLSIFLTVYPCFDFKKNAGTSRFPFRALIGN
jgi:hypothetical protein